MLSGDIILLCQYFSVIRDREVPQKCFVLSLDKGWPATPRDKDEPPRDDPPAEAPSRPAPRATRRPEQNPWSCGPLPGGGPARRPRAASCPQQVAGGNDPENPAHGRRPAVARQRAQPRRRSISLRGR